MNRKIQLLLAAVALSAIALMADPILYWMRERGEDGARFALVRESVLQRQNEASNALAVAEAAAKEESPTSATWAELSGLTRDQYRFVVELYNQNSTSSMDWDLMGLGAGAATYGDLLSLGYVYTGLFYGK